MGIGYTLPAVENPGSERLSGGTEFVLLNLRQQNRNCVICFDAENHE
jgi:hypothetical protein